MIGLSSAEHLPALEDIAERKGNGYLCKCEKA